MASVARPCTTGRSPIALKMNLYRAWVLEANERRKGSEVEAKRRGEVRFKKGKRFSQTIDDDDCSGTRGEHVFR